MESEILEMLRKIRKLLEPKLPPSIAKEFHSVELEGFAEPRSRFGFVVGRTFEVRYRARNTSSQVFPGGTLRVSIHWPDNRVVTEPYNIPTLDPDDEYIVEKNEQGQPITAAALAQGYARFVAVMEANDRNPVIIESPRGTPRIPPVSFYSILARSPEEVYGHLALVVALAVLLWTAVAETLSLSVAFGFLNLGNKSIPTMLAVLAATLGYFFGLADIGIKKRLLGLVSTGALAGFIPVSILTTAILGMTQNTQPLITMLVYAPFYEELSKLLGLLLLTRLLLPQLTEVTKYDVTRIGGGIGLGFAVFETLAYIIKGAEYHSTICRLLISVPFHTSSVMWMSFGEAEKDVLSQVLLLLLAVALHIVSNLLAIYSAILQGIVFWALLGMSYLMSDKMYFRKPH